MDELDRTRRFREHVAAPTDDARRHARDRLAHAMSPTGRRAVRHPRRAPRLALGGAVAVAAVAGGLALVRPWGGGPDIVARAAAALSLPDGQIVHMKRWGSPTNGDSATVGPVEWWSTTSAPFNGRVAFSNRPGGPTHELEGTPFQPEWGYDEATNTIRRVTRRQETPAGAISSPVDLLLSVPRQLLEQGRARNAGATEIDGRPVYKLVTDDDVVTGSPPGVTHELVLYVDRETYLPVAEDTTITSDGKRVTTRVHVEVEYLAATTENLALTSIRKQHPGARVGEPTADPDRAQGIR